jgi:hypothetical protein
LRKLYIKSSGVFGVGGVSGSTIVGFIWLSILSSSFSSWNIDNIDNQIKPTIVEPETPPTPKTPDDFIYNFLKEYNLECWNDIFIGQNYKSKEDLVRLPLLKEDDLDKLGINKISDRKKLVEKISKLVNEDETPDNFL